MIFFILTLEKMLLKWIRSMVTTYCSCHPF